MDQPAHHDMKQERRYAQEDRRYQQRHPTQFLDLVGHKIVRSLVLAVVCANPTIRSE